MMINGCFVNRLTKAGFNSSVEAIESDIHGYGMKECARRSLCGMYTITRFEYHDSVFVSSDFGEPIQIKNARNKSDIDCVMIAIQAAD